MSEEAGFEQLVRRHAPALARLAAAYERDPVRREDLAQEILLAVWRALPRFRGESSEAAFVFRIAHNRALTHGFRAGRAKALPLEEGPEPVDPAPDPEARAEAAGRRRRLEAAIAELPLGLRAVLLLSLEDLSQREIGEALGISEANVAVRLHRARAAVRRALGEPR